MCFHNASSETTHSYPQTLTPSPITVVPLAEFESSRSSITVRSQANSAIETNLNTYISKEESLISTQQKSLTAELNNANQILQALPSQLNGINEIYSAISGYNRRTNG